VISHAEHWPSAPARDEAAESCGRTSMIPIRRPRRLQRYFRERCLECTVRRLEKSHRATAAIAWVPHCRACLPATAVTPCLRSQDAKRPAAGQEHHTTGEFWRPGVNRRRGCGIAYMALALIAVGFQNESSAELFGLSHAQSGGEGFPRRPRGPNEFGSVLLRRNNRWGSRLLRKVLQRRPRPASR